MYSATILLLLAICLPSVFCCDCDYHNGGCTISIAARLGWKCVCNYKGAWTCGGYAVQCDEGETCPANCSDSQCCHRGGGDCGGYRMLGAGAPMDPVQVQDEYHQYPEEHELHQEILKNALAKTKEAIKDQCTLRDGRSRKCFIWDIAPCAGHLSGTIARCVFEISNQHLQHLLLEECMSRIVGPFDACSHCLCSVMEHLGMGYCFGNRPFGDGLMLN
eukprot:GFUD01026938.1.p1 GENE.GFUD01026938.1~~GFUD01026938.1.p1  ORF type:complete len:218 (-),score=13.93 GFUD01026938.1:51-704(-)